MPTPLVTAVICMLAAGLVAWWLHVWFWTRRFAVLLRYDACERLPTGDGGYIELRRVCAAARAGASESQSPQGGGEAPAEVTGIPVLLVHGLGANHRNFDLDERHSLARHLARAGRDVWLVTLRSALRPRGVSLGFAAMANHDLPLAVQTVLARTGAARLDYIGFSMGGMLLYASLGRALDPRFVRRIVTVGSPAQLRMPWSLVARWMRWAPSWMWSTVHLRLAARTAAFAAEWFRSPLHRYLFNPENVAKGVAQRALVNIIEDVPADLNRDFAGWLSSPEGQLSVEGVPVVGGLSKMRHPALFVAGAADKIAPPRAVRVAFEVWGGPDKTWRVLGRSWGMEHDYGHGDLAVGAQLERDFYVPVERFLASAVPCPPRS